MFTFGNRAASAAAGTFCVLALTGVAVSQERSESALEEVVVTATRFATELRDVPASVTVLNRGDLERNAVLVPGDELRAVPGFFVRRAEDAESFQLPVVRGLAGSHGNDNYLALVDGIPLISAHEEVDNYFLPIGIVDRIEIVRGPTSALYGRGGVGGAVNYLTRAPAANHETDVRLSLGRYDYGKGALSWTGPFGESNRALFDGYYEKNGGWREHSERESYNTFLKLETRIGDALTSTAYLNLYDVLQESSGFVPLRADGSVVRTRGGLRGFAGFLPYDYDRRSYMAAWRLAGQPSDSLQWQTTVHFRRTEDANDINFYDSSVGLNEAANTLTVNGFSNDRRGDTLFFEPQVSWSSGRHKLIGGLNLERIEHRESDRWTGEFGFDTNTFEFKFYRIDLDYLTGEVLNRASPLWLERNEIYRGDATNRFYAAYVQDEITLTERLKLTAGVRYDRFERDADIDSDVDFDGLLDDNPTISDEASDTSPKLALTYRLSDAVTGYASFGQGFSSNFAAIWQWDPSLYQRGSDVKPSTVRQYEVGVKGAVAERLGFALALYQLNQKNRLAFAPNPGGPFLPSIQINADEFESRGVELETTVRLASALTASVTYAYVDAEWKNFVDPFNGTDYSGLEPAGVPRQTASARLAWNVTRELEVGASWEYYDDYIYTTDNAFRGGGHDLVNLTFAWRPADRFGALEELSLVVLNALDRDYLFFFGDDSQPLNARPGLPLQAFASARFRF